MPSIVEIATLIQCQVLLIELELAGSETEAEIEQRRKNTEVTINLFDLDARIKRAYEARIHHLESRIADLEGSIRRLEEVGRPASSP